MQQNAGDQAASHMTQGQVTEAWILKWNRSVVWLPSL